MPLGLFALLGILAALVAPSAALRPAASPTLTLRPGSTIAVAGSYSEIVADGGRAVAIGGCDLFVWRAYIRAGNRLAACRDVGEEDSSFVYDVAVAGKRVAWLRQESASHDEVIQQELMVWSGGAPTQVANTYSEYGHGDALQAVAGSGDTLAFGWYNWDSEEETVTAQAVYRVASPPRAPRAGTCPWQAKGLYPNPPRVSLCVKTAASDVSVRSAAAGRILVSKGNAFELVERNNIVRELSVPGYDPDRDSLALTASQLVVLQPKALLVFGLEPFEQVARWPIAAAGERPVSVGRGFALFRARDGFRIVRLTEGAARVVAPPRGTRLIDALLTEAGLFALYQPKKGPRRLAFVPPGRLS